jgi:uncharacterized membrane protein
VKRIKTSAVQAEVFFMGRGRLEAFSDGVIAIIITLMVLELKVPHGAELSDLLVLGPVFLSYVLSFANVGIYWNNHHHLLHTVEKVTGGILWANLLLLFCLSLMPFTTAWMGENQFATWPVVLYAVDLLLCAVAYTILQHTIIRSHGKNSALAAAVGAGIKEKISLASYIISIPMAFYASWISGLLLFVVAFMWLIPDSRIEKRTQSF